MRSQLCSKRSSKGPSSGNFLATGGFFERSTYRVTALGCLKKESQRWWTILAFDLLHVAITTADWGRLYKLLDVLLYASICSLAMPWYRRENADWSRHLEIEPPYIWATLPRAHNILCQPVHSIVAALQYNIFLNFLFLWRAVSNNKILGSNCACAKHSVFQIL